MSQRTSMPKSEVWLVASGNQSLKGNQLIDGIYTNSGFETGLADCQLGVINWD